MENGLSNKGYDATATPHLTQEAVIALVREDLRARSFNYDTEKGFWPVFHGFRKVRDGRVRPLWTVAFVTRAREVPFRGKIVEVPEEDFFGCVDDEAKELLYITHSTGYIEPASVG